MSTRVRDLTKHTSAHGSAAAAQEANQIRSGTVRNRAAPDDACMFTGRLIYWPSHVPPGNASERSTMRQNSLETADIKSPSAEPGYRWSAQYPEVARQAVSTESYISDDFFERERERVFARAWLYAGRVEDIPQAGDYFVKKIDICRTSVLVVRGDDGIIRGFHNVCTHRCNELVWDQAGSARAFTCRFHGWTFRCDGQLSGVPDEAQFEAFDKDVNGLKAVATDTWKGFIFVNLAPAPRSSLSEYLGQLTSERISDYDFARPADYWTWRVSLRCNWKVLLDAFSEGYHAPFVHRGTVAGLIKTKDNPLVHLEACRIYGLHHMYTIPANPSFSRPGLVADAAFRYAPLMTRYRDSEVMKRLPRGVNPSDSKRWGFDTYYVFPNVLFSMFGDWWHIHHFEPIGTNRTQWTLRVFFPRAENAAQRFAQEYTSSLLQDNMLEDLGTVESSQRGMESRVVSHFNLQANEILIRHNHFAIKQFMDS